MRRSPHFLIAFLFLNSFSFAVAQELPFVHYTTEDPRIPLPSASVQQVYQDHLGDLWFAFFSAGLARYDGRNLEVYDFQDGLIDRTVRDLLQDASGRLWAPSDAGLAVSAEPLSEATTRRRVRFLDRVGDVRLISSRLRRGWVSIAPEGGVYSMSPSDGLLHYRFTADGELEHRRLDFTPPGGGSGGGVLYLDHDETFWLLLESGEIGRWTPGDEDVHFLDEDVRPQGVVNAMHRDSSGTLWWGTLDGRLGRVGEGGRFTEVDSLPAYTSSLVEIDGDLWASTLGGGLLRLGKETGALRIGRRQGLPSDTVWRIVRDREANLWFPHNGGISRLRANYRAFSHYTDAWLPARTAFAVVAPAIIPSSQNPGAAESWTWVGTGSGLSIIRGDEASFLTRAEGLADSSVYALGRDHRNRIWIGTLRGLSVLSFRDDLPRDCGPVRSVRVFEAQARLVSCDFSTTYSVTPFENPDGTRGVWASGVDGVALWIDESQGERFIIFSTPTGLPAEGAISAAFDAQSRVWVGTKASGILRSGTPLTIAALDDLPREGLRVSQSLFEPFWDEHQGAPSQHVQNLFLAAGKMWAGTPAGLFAFSEDDQTPQRFGRETGLGGDHVLAVAQDEEGMLWMTQNSGLARFDPHSGETLMVVAQRHGLLDNEAWSANALDLGADGTVYFATPKGLTLYRPHLDQIPQISPQVRLRRVERQPAGHTIAFQYAAASFVQESEIVYRTRLVGWDDRWTTPSRETGTRYTNLPALLTPRNYVFEVQAGSSDGEWGPLLRYEFEVEPPWWLTWQTAGLCAAALLGVLVAGYRLRTRRLHHRAAELEAAVDQRTRELQRHLDELETLDLIVHAINQEVEIEGVMEALLEQGLRLVPAARRGVFGTLDREADQFEIRASSGWDPDLLEGISFSVADAFRRYSESGRRLAKGISLVQRPQDRVGAEKVRHLPLAEAMLTIEIALGEQVEGFLIFDIYEGVESLMHDDPDALQRYRQHAITALEKAQAYHALRHTNEELEEKNRQILLTQAQLVQSEKLASLGQLVAGVAHEINNPVNFISAGAPSLERLLQKMVDALPQEALSENFQKAHHQVCEILEVVQEGARRTAEIVRNLRSFSRLDHSEIAPADLHQMLDATLSLLQHVLKERVEVVREYGDIPTVECYIGQVNQVFMNLLSNAAQAIEGSGTITVRSENYTSSTGVEMVKIRVRDTGSGIPEEALDKVFDPFFTTRRVGEGTGLGLSITHGIVEKHGGKIEIVETSPRGTEFAVSLPVRLSAEALLRS